MAMITPKQSAQRVGGLVPITSRRWVLRRVPEGLPRPEDFELIEEQLPAPKVSVCVCVRDPGQHIRTSRC